MVKQVKDISSMEVQGKLNNMVNGKRLVSRIDSSLSSTNQGMNSIRLELDVTNQKLKEISIIKDVCSRCQEATDLNKLAVEKKTLSSSNRQLLKEIANLKQQILNSENRHKEAIESLKSDRDRLRADKSELLSQIQETQKTIDDKEEQLREFIRESRKQMEENDVMINEADQERNRLCRERNDLSRKQQDLTEVVATLRGELVSSEKKIRELEADNLHLRNNAVQSQPSKRRSLHFTVDENLSTQRTLTITATEPNTSTQSHDPLLIPGSPVSPRGYLGPNGSTPETHCSSSSAEDIDGDFLPVTECLGQSYGRRPPKLVQHLSGSFSRAFKLGRNRKSLEIVSNVETFLEANSFNTENWTEDEKREILMNSHNLPMLKWKADSVLVWLEQIMHMPQYVKECQDNIKSGKVLLGLSEAELTKCLGISNTLHCRKLMLAIDEFRSPANTIANTSPKGKLDHWWVCEQWLRDVALTQYTSRFREHLIDGRTLASLTKKDLDRFMGMDGKKTHQESIIRGVQLLDLLRFNKQRLDERRQMCESSDTDLLVWNNSRLIQWVKSIDLKEYSINLKDSGVHGALIVLDPNFTSDDMASALGIPVNKATVRRHLASEFETLVKQARESLDDEAGGGNLDIYKRPMFFRSNSTSSRFRRSIKSSISRTIGRQLSRENQPSNIK